MMLNFRLACLIVIAFLLNLQNSVAQEASSATNRLFAFPDHFFNALDQKSEKVEKSLTNATLKYLRKLEKQELKLSRRLAKEDSAVAHEIFSDISGTYRAMEKTIADSAADLHPLRSDYNGHLDSVKTALAFLQNQNVLSQSKEFQEKYQGVLTKYSGLQSKLNQTHSIQKLLVERQKLLQEKISSLGLSKKFSKYKQTIYYYRAQIKEYKDIFSQPDKWESKLLGVAQKIPAFAKFFSKHSELASIFRLPDAETGSLESLQGLQTRAALVEELNNRFGTGFNVPQAVNAGVRNAQPGIDLETTRFDRTGSAGNDIDMPNFRPNSQKTKSFLKRLEFGTNIQNTKNNIFFPTTTDFGFSLGYKINTKSVFGVGTSYKMGWGKDFRHIAITHQGLGFRSFVDVRLKGSFWLTGGGELNYRTAFERIDQLKNYKDWQPAALAGVSKKYQIKNKVKGNVQLLYDFLSAQQVPRTQSVLFRIGYSFN